MRIYIESGVHAHEAGIKLLRVCACVFLRVKTFRGVGEDAAVISDIVEAAGERAEEGRRVRGICVSCKWRLIDGR